jgi:DNA-binding response OmpR family regulator
MTTTARVLLIEDEPALARGLSDTLRANGFDVTVATDGERGLDAATRGDVDLILLDVMLPKVDGYEICRAVRSQGIEVPILMLTAKGREQDVVQGPESRRRRLHHEAVPQRRVDRTRPRVPAPPRAGADDVPLR